MRIVGGSHRGRHLIGPDDRSTRPTSDRVREALFNILLHQPALQGHLGQPPLPCALVVDAFAGSGALAFEALSRGAEAALLFETAAPAQKAIQANARALHLQDRATLLRTDVCHPPQARQAAGLVFLDPPYRSDLASVALDALRRAGWISTDTLAVVESAADADWQPPEGWRRVFSRRQGPAMLDFLRLPAP